MTPSATSLPVESEEEEEEDFFIINRGLKVGTVRHRGIGTGISEANKMMIMLFTVLFRNKEFLFFPLLPWEASKRVSIFESGTGSKHERLRSGSLKADLSLIV